MALIGINPDEIIEYISEHDKDGTNPTVFQIGVVDALTIAKIEDGLTVFTIDPKNPESKTDTKLSTGKRETELVRAGLKGWKNFKDKNGNDLPFETIKQRATGKTVEVPNDTTLGRIPVVVFKELANVIYNQNKLSDEETKN